MCALLLSLGCGGPGQRHKKSAPGPEVSEVLFCGKLLPTATTENVVCEDNAVTDLSPLAHLRNLKHLKLSSWSGNVCVTDLNPLSGLRKLETIDLSYMAIDDISPLAEVSSIVALNIRGTKVRDIRSLRGLVHLERLDASYTQVDNIGILSEVASLKFLNISRTGVEDITPLSGLMHLETLLLVGLSLDHIEALESVASLRELHIPWRRVKLAPLFQLQHLRELYVTTSRVSADELLAMQQKTPELVVNPPQGTIYLDSKRIVGVETVARESFCK